jgi:hypothetical protein
MAAPTACCPLTLAARDATRNGHEILDEKHELTAIVERRLWHTFRTPEDRPRAVRTAPD